MGPRQGSIPLHGPVACTMPGSCSSVSAPGPVASRACPPLWVTETREALREGTHLGCLAQAAEGVSQAGRSDFGPSEPQVWSVLFPLWAGGANPRGSATNYPPWGFPKATRHLLGLTYPLSREQGYAASAHRWGRGRPPSRSPPTVVSGCLSQASFSLL